MDSVLALRTSGKKVVAWKEVRSRDRRERIRKLPAKDAIEETPLSKETYEWNEGRIPHAFYTGRGNLERDIETYVPDTHDDIVLYCAGGVRSLLAAESLKRMGYKNVSSLAGGIGAWKAAGEEVHAPPGKTFSTREEY
ncbi:Rhodanese-like domain-containing protein [Chytriomyces sp. MP71]|nr:Rhodanese-like domain-containing protein [Chytriomyces sp. MP71]